MPTTMSGDRPKKGGNGPLTGGQKGGLKDPKKGPKTQDPLEALPKKEVKIGHHTVTIPLPINTRVLCTWAAGADGDIRPARIIERRLASDAADEYDIEYYMHFIGFNRRMDEWHPMHDMDASEMETDEMFEARKAAAMAAVVAATTTMEGGGGGGGSSGGGGGDGGWWWWW